MSLDSKLPNPNPYGINIWFTILIGVIIEAIINFFVLSFAEEAGLKIGLISCLTLFVIGGIFLYSTNRRKRIIEILYDEKKHIEKKERVPLYKLGKKYDLSKRLLLNRVTVNKERRVTSLNLSSFNLDKLPRAIRKLQNLTQIKCKGSKLGRLSKIIKKMGKLEILDFMRTELINLEGISKLKKLRILKMMECGIEDISAIAGLTELEEMNLMRNNITNIDALVGMKNLRRLNLSENQVKDISVLDKLESLRSISVSLNPINDFKPIMKRKMESISFSVMYQAYSDEITEEELTIIKSELIKQFEEVRAPHRYNTIMQGGLRDYGYTVTLHGGTIDN